MIPRAVDLPERLRGPGVFGLLEVDPADEVGEADPDALALALRESLGPLPT